ncbi:MAG: alpha/beta fold hydrolase [Cyanobium sp.]|jgi:8-oxo-dGTP pyrophosphatase MutT (NUDIX family)/pimeloyl-ACP methyl ester carboxylesterase
MTDLALTVAGGNENALGDVLFIHGLGGSGTDTWTSDGQLKDGEASQDFVSFFPAVLAADFPELRFLTLEYSAEATRWADNLRWNELHRVAAAVLEYLQGSGIGEKPLIIVAHSLGGIVAKELLKTSYESMNPRKKAFFSSVRAISFLATPHKGSKWADIVTKINGALPFIRPTSRIQELMFDSVYLEQLSAWYRDTIKPDLVETQAFYEQRPTGQVIVVDHVSANPDVSGCEPIPVDQDHINICKPASKKAPVYVGICGLIRHHLLKEEADEPLPPQTVVIGLVVHDGKVLMVRRKHTIDRLTWQFVAGRLRALQETEEECIVREIREETGITVRARNCLGSIVDQHVPYKRIYYSCEYLTGMPINADDEENSDVAWVPIGDVERYSTTPISRPVRDYLGLPNGPT